MLCKVPEASCEDDRLYRVTVTCLPRQNLWGIELKLFFMLPPQNANVYFDSGYTLRLFCAYVYNI